MAGRSAGMGRRIPRGDGDAARNHVLLLERDYELHPDQAIFQSLQVNPTHAMPDSAQDALTSLVNFYFTPAVKALRGEK
jgi:hypothetical protein